QGSLSGEVDLNLKAKLKGQPSDHEYSFELNATKANIVKINPVEWFNTVSSEAFPITKNAPSSVGNTRFASIFSKGVLRNKILKVFEVKIDDIDKKYKIWGKGNLSFLSTGKSELFLNYTSEVDIGVDVLPLMMVGRGLNLRPEIEYTIRNLTNKKSRNKK